MRLRIIFGIVLFSLFACNSSSKDLDYVKSTMWQWDSGYKIGDGDFVDFDTSNFYTLSHDTIFRKGIAKCVVIATKKKIYQMTVKSLDGQMGYYTDTEEFTK